MVLGWVWLATTVPSRDLDLCSSAGRAKKKKIKKSFFFFSQILCVVVTGRGLGSVHGPKRGSTEEAEEQERGYQRQQRSQGSSRTIVSTGNQPATITSYITIINRQ